MSDIFREVDEALQRERMEKLWARHRWQIIGGVLALVVATAAITGYKSFRLTRAEQASETLVYTVEQAADSENETAGRENLERLETLGKQRNGTGMLALFHAASLAAVGGEVDRSLVLLDKIIAGPFDDAYKELAELKKAALLLENSETMAEMQNAFTPFIDEAADWRVFGLYLLALAALEDGSAPAKAQAVEALKTLLDEIPAGTSFHTHVERILHVVSLEDRQHVRPAKDDEKPRKP